MKLLHFADAHIDMASHGRHDPVTGLPVRVLDFLKALDTIVDAAIQERVDLVIFAGDAYKDRTPVPTFQREWGRRIVRLSQAGIPTLLLVGNHDISPAVGRANTLQEFDTLQVPHVKVLSKPAFLGPQDLEGLPLQVIALPWVTRSGLMASQELSAEKPEEIFAALEARLTGLIEAYVEKADPDLPLILTAHASVQGALYGAERAVMLGADVVLPGSLVCDPRLDYVALGHIHKAQNLNEHAHPPVIYPGSIERVDFGEAADEKFYVIAEVERGHSEVYWHKLEGRRFIDRYVMPTSGPQITEQAIAALPEQDALQDAAVRLIIEYPREWEALIDEAAIRRQAEGAFEFHLIRRPQMEARLRLSAGQSISNLSALDLLDMYWKTINAAPEDAAEYQRLAQEILQGGGQPVGEA